MLATKDIPVSHLSIIAIKCEMSNLHNEKFYLCPPSYRLHSMISWPCFGAVARQHIMAGVHSEAKLACVML